MAGGEGLPEKLQAEIDGTPYVETGCCQAIERFKNDSIFRKFFWKQYSQFSDTKPATIFSKIELAKDGGLSEIGEVNPKIGADPLWWATRPLSALITLIFIFSNVYFIVSVDLCVVHDFHYCSANGRGGHAGPHPHEHSEATTTSAAPLSSIDEVNERNERAFLLSGAMIDKITQFANAILSLFGQGLDDSQIPSPEMIISGVELLVMFGILAKMLYRIGRIIYWRSTPCQRWYNVASLCWDLIPEVCVFSAMRLLYYITPQILAIHLYDAIVAIQAGDSGCSVRTFGIIFRFLFTRAVCFVVGFDSFLVKYRAAYQYVVVEETSLHAVLGAVVFLNQGLGVVQIGWVIRERLFRFVFGGEDCIIQRHEKAKQDVWNALAAFQIHYNYWTLKRAPLKYISIMLTFCDDDFQALIMNDRSDKAKEAVHEEGSAAA